MKKIATTIVLVWLVSLFLQMSPFQVHAESTGSLDELYIEVGDALIHVKEKNWDEASQNIQAFETYWSSMEKTEGKQADDVSALLSELRAALENPEKNDATLGDSLTQLSKALVAYDEFIHPTSTETENVKLEQLKPFILHMEEQLKANQLEEAKQQYELLLSEWNGLETIVRNESVAAYGAFETQMAFIRIAIEQEPADLEKAQNGIESLRQTIDDFVAGNVTAEKAKESYQLADVVSLLEESQQAMESKNSEDAIASLNEVLLIWPSVEGEVQTRDSSLYNDVENRVPLAISLLSSEKKDWTKANQMVTDLVDQLSLIASKTEYTFVDALLILLREGLEAILIITGLIAFLKKTGNGRMQRWIWGGAVAGVLASAALAVAIHLFLSAVTAASSREYLEGIIGLIAVAMMLTVGAWLHKRSSAKMWDHYVKKQIGQAIARGSLISMTALSFLSIFREGAETIIFYAGMAPSISTSQLVLGIALASVILLVFGFVIIRYSSRIPLRPFFLVATGLIYVLAFKMLGVSIHALQVASVIDTHSIAGVPFIDLIGLYPSWETLIPQVAILVAILTISLYVRAKSKKQMVVSTTY